jgi:hypothetical protein
MPNIINASTSSGLVQTADTSGTIDFQSSGATKLTVSTSGTSIAQYTPATSLITSDTVKASTSGTSIEFTGIPSWVKRITVMLNGVSTNGSSNIQIQIGSSSFTTSGYLGSVQVSSVALAFTTGFGVSYNHTSVSNLYGIYRVQLITGNTWVYDGMNTRSSDNGVTLGSGSLALSGTLDRVRITTVNGTDTFDAGSINILYE